MERTNEERSKSRRPERALSLSDPELATAGNLLTDFLRSFETSLDGRRVMPVLDHDQLAELFATPFPEVGIGVESLFRDIRAKVLPNCTTVAHRRFLAYVLGPPNGIAPFAEAVAAALNQNCNFWQLSPAASVIERKVISWLGSLFGYPQTAGGILTSGGSMANLMALSVAMHDKAPADLRNAGLSALASPLVVYTSAEAHRSVEKGAAILGLGLNNVRKIPVDSDFQLRVDLLERAIEEDRRAGATPFCAVATAGTVNTGAIDPIDEIADLCAREGLWFHIDGAYGALFVLTDQMKGRLSCCGRADSITLDPHKLLFAPLEAGSLIVQNSDKLRDTFHFSSSYLSVEPARVRAERAMELLAPVPLTAVCFAFRNGASTHTILAKLVEEGTAILGPVRINGRSGIRACITNYRTTESDIDFVLDRVLQLAKISRSTQ